MTKATEIQNILDHSTGTVSYHRWQGDLLITDGVKLLSENGLAWLVDLVWSYRTNYSFKREPFQVWTLEVDLDSSTGRVTMTDGNSKTALLSQDIPFTDCPVSKITLYLSVEGNHRILMINSEY